MSEQDQSPSIKMQTQSTSIVGSINMKTDCFILLQLGLSGLHG